MVSPVVAAEVAAEVAAVPDRPDRPDKQGQSTQGDLSDHSDAQQSDPGDLSDRQLASQQRDRQHGAQLAQAPEANYSGRLDGVVRMDALDVTAFVAICIFSGMAMLALLANWPAWVPAICAFGLAILSLGLAYSHVTRRPDHLRARESGRVSHIANKAMTLVKDGLTMEGAQAVCDLVLKATPNVAAVALTNDHKVLGFSGVGADHHTPGRPIVTRATRQTIELAEAVVLSSKIDIGCPNPACPLRAAIIVPLVVQDRAVGTLKYYFLDESLLTETELAGAEGLARLLSTQLIIHELEEQAALATQMELKALQAQINPHFLFNTLNTISAYIRTDAEVARHLLRQFAAFYRRTLEHGDQPITLGLELEFLKQYFELEKARFGDQISLSLDIDERAVDLPMPAFMLQPLVENSIGHGMRADGQPLSIQVVVVEGEGAASWMLRVTDDGVGMEPEFSTTVFGSASSKGLGVALQNVADRLRGFYGPESRLTIDSMPGEGTSITFYLPA